MATDGSTSISGDGYELHGMEALSVFDPWRVDPKEDGEGRCPFDSVENESLNLKPLIANFLQQGFGEQ